MYHIIKTKILNNQELIDYKELFEQDEIEEDVLVDEIIEKIKMLKKKELDQEAKMKILHITTHNENCGIGLYAQDYIEKMEELGYSQIIFPVTPNIMKIADRKQFSKILNLLDSYLTEIDIIHIQHEFGFYNVFQLDAIIKRCKYANKKVILTVHTAPSYTKSKFTFYKPKKLISELKGYFLINQFYKLRLNSFKYVDKVIVHNDFTKRKIQKYIKSMKDEMFFEMPIPVPIHNILQSDALTVTKFNQILDKLRYDSSVDKLIIAPGFLSDIKGSEDAIWAMKYLPNNYKLIIAGGIHPRAGNDDFLNKLAKITIEQNLTDRVYITGVLPRMLQIHIVAQADVVIYPYHKEYSSSSAAVNLGLSAFKTVITYPCRAFKLLKKKSNSSIICTEIFSYYELAQQILKVDVHMETEMRQKTKDYYLLTNLDILKKKLAELYEII